VQAERSRYKILNNKVWIWLFNNTNKCIKEKRFRIQPSSNQKMNFSGFCVIKGIFKIAHIKTRLVAEKVLLPNKLANIQELQLKVPTNSYTVMKKRWQLMLYQSKM